MMYSKLAIAGVAIYLIAFASAASYPHFDHSTFSGVFAVLLALPWIDYFPSQMPAAVALNALIIYVVLTALSHLPAWLRQSR
jgi:hypothetical protein